MSRAMVKNILIDMLAHRGKTLSMPKEIFIRYQIRPVSGGTPLWPSPSVLFDKSSPAFRRASAIQMYHDGKKSIPSLRKMLEDKDATVCRTARVCLDRLGDTQRKLNDDPRNVLVHWEFIKNQPDTRFSPFLELRGDSKIILDGPHGVSLEINPTGDASLQADAGAKVAVDPMLFPKGAFTIEIWFSPDSAMSGKTGYLLDSMGSHALKAGYFVQMVNAAGGHIIQIWLGHGKDNEFSKYNSSVISFAPETWYHLSFSYNGNGEGKIFINGVTDTVHHKQGAGSVLPQSQYFMGIGNRSVQKYAPFFGKIGGVRITHTGEEGE